MRSFVALLLLCLVVPGSQAYRQDACLDEVLPVELGETVTWSKPLRRLQLPEPLIAPSVQAVDGRAFILGGAPLVGRTIHVDPTTAIRSLDADAHAVGTERAELPRGRFAMGSAATSVGVVIMGGDYYGTVSRDIQVYEPDGTLRAKQARLPSGRSDMATAWDGHQVWAAGGFFAGKELVSYDPIQDRVVAYQGVLPSPRRGTSGFITDGTFYVIGGYDESTGFLDQIVAIDLDTHRARVLATPLPTPRTGVAVLQDGTGAYLVGGYGPSGALADVLRFDARSGLLVPVGALPEPRSQPGIARVGDLVYVVGGGSETRFDRTYAQHRDMLVLGTVAEACARPDLLLSNLVQIIDVDLGRDDLTVVGIGPAVDLTVECLDASCVSDGLAEVVPHGLPAPPGHPSIDAPVFVHIDSVDVGDTRLRIEVDSALAAPGVDPQDLTLYRYDGKAWVDLEGETTTVERDGNHVSAAVERLGTFALAPRAVDAPGASQPRDRDEWQAASETGPGPRSTPLDLAPFALAIAAIAALRNRRG